MGKKSEPLESITWEHASSLNANDYNPNVVYNAEFQLLEYNILRHGWIQPVLISDQKRIIDGFHRWRLSLDSERLKARYNGRLPCVALSLSEPEAMMLTIRINRAKGSHIALRMSSIVKRLIDEMGVAPDYVAQCIGATKEEVNLLHHEGVFEAKDIKNYRYGKAWVPKERT